MENMLSLSGTPLKAEVGECVEVDPLLPPIPSLLLKYPVPRKPGKAWQESVIRIDSTAEYGSQGSTEK